MADRGNNRVLEYSAPLAVDPAAHLVLGQANSFSTIAMRRAGLDRFIVRSRRRGRGQFR